MHEVFGIDVSHHNGKIDWGAVRRDGKEFAILKCQYEAQSHRIDEFFEYNYAEAGKYGIFTSPGHPWQILKAMQMLSLNT